MVTQQSLQTVYHMNLLCRREVADRELRTLSLHLSGSASTSPFLATATKPEPSRSVGAFSRGLPCALSEAQMHKNKHDICSNFG